MRCSYDQPAAAGLLPDSTLRIVDLGGNIGLTSFYFLAKSGTSRRCLKRSGGCDADD